MYALKNSDKELKSKDLYLHKNMFDNAVQIFSTSIFSKLKALIESKPLSNKLLTKVFVFRHKRTSECSVININDVS